MRVQRIGTNNGTSFGVNVESFQPLETVIGGMLNQRDAEKFTRLLRSKRISQKIKSMKLSNGENASISFPKTTYDMTGVNIEIKAKHAMSNGTGYSSIYIKDDNTNYDYGLFDKKTPRYYLGQLLTSIKKALVNIEYNTDYVKYKLGTDTDIFALQKLLCRLKENNIKPRFLTNSKL